LNIKNLKFYADLKNVNKPQRQNAPKKVKFKNVKNWYLAKFGPYKALFNFSFFWEQFVTEANQDF
jgi:hypothetical protein